MMTLLWNKKETIDAGVNIMFESLLKGFSPSNGLDTNMLFCDTFFLLYGKFSL